MQGQSNSKRNDKDFCEQIRELKVLLNKSVVTYRAAPWWGNTDYKCVGLLMLKENFDQLESLLGSINGRIGKQYEGGGNGSSNVT